MHEITLNKIGTVLLTQSQIRAIVSRLAAEIKKTYLTVPEIMVIVLLTGAKQVADDLFELINDDKFHLHYLKVSSYNHSTTSSGNVEFHNNIEAEFKNKSVLIIDDIYDTGITLSKVIENIKKHTIDVKTCVLLEKKTRHQSHIDIDFRGIRIENSFIIGYGLDYQGKYRELPFIARLNLPQD